MCVCWRECLNVSVCARARVYVCACERGSVYVDVCVCTCVRAFCQYESTHVWKHACVSCLCVCVSVCLCVCPSDCLSVYLLACWFARMYTGMNESIILRRHAFIKSMHIAAFIPKHMRVCMKRTC